MRRTPRSCPRRCRHLACHHLSRDGGAVGSLEPREEGQIKEYDLSVPAMGPHVPDAGEPVGGVIGAGRGRLRSIAAVPRSREMGGRSS